MLSAHAVVLYIFPLIGVAVYAAVGPVSQLRAAVDDINPDCFAGTAIAGDRKIIAYTCL